jgi:hypothetical protein
MFDFLQVISRVGILEFDCKVVELVDLVKELINLAY